MEVYFSWRCNKGEVYFVAPDAEFKTFTKRFLEYRHLVCRTINSLNNDCVPRGIIDKMKGKTDWGTSLEEISLKEE